MRSLCVIKLLCHYVIMSLCHYVIMSLCHYEATWLDDCPASIKPVFYWRCVDDIFWLFNDSNQCDKFLTYTHPHHMLS